MADKDFVVKNGLQVNGGTWVVNSTAVYYSGSFVSNSTVFGGNANTATTANTANTANNASYLGGVAAAAYVNTSGNFTISGNLNLTGTNNYVASALYIGNEVVANTTTLFLGNSSTNVVVNSSGFYVNGTLNQTSGSSGGYYKGNAGTSGNTNNINNLYRINANTQSNNITIVAGENALAAGPMTISNGFNLTIETGGRVVLV